MNFPVDRRTAFSGVAGAALGYGVSDRLSAGTVAAAPAALPGSATPAADPAGAGWRFPSVRDKGARGDGTTMDSAAIQAALDAFDTLWVPPGVYMIDTPLTIPSYRVLSFASEAIFCPAHDGMTVFRTGEVSYASRILAPRIHARGKRGVTAFDLQGFRHRAEIQHADILECARGIVLRELCWDTILYMPWIRQTELPLVIVNGSNAVDVIHPAIDGFDTGVTIAAGKANATTTVRILGGYVQNGRYGIVDRGCFGTIVDGTYFEGLKEADIALSGAIRPNLTRTQHYGNVGKVAIRATGVDGLTIFDPLMSSGVRSIGLYDFDAACRNVTRFEVDTAVGVNRPLGNVSGSRTLAIEESGGFTPVIVQPRDGGIAYRRQAGRWRRSGSQLTVAIDLVWSGAVGGGAMTVALPAAALLPSSVPVGAIGPVMIAGIATLAHARLDGGNLHVVTIANGTERPVPVPANGALTTTLTCLI